MSSSFWVTHIGTLALWILTYSNPFIKNWHKVSHYYELSMIFLMILFWLIISFDWMKDIPLINELLVGGTSSYQFSPTSLVNPCITGLFNGEVLRAMKANGLYLLLRSFSFFIFCKEALILLLGIYNAVGDNSVPRLVSPNPYHIVSFLFLFYMLFIHLLL